MFCCVFSLAKQGARNEELKRADAVVLTYACDEPVSFERVTTYWLPELHKLEVGFASCFSHWRFRFRNNEV